MSLLVQAQTSDDDEEIMGCLQMVLSSSKRGLIHESVRVDYSTSYTRRLFSFSSLLSFLPLLSLLSFFSLYFPFHSDFSTLTRGFRELVCLGERRVCRDDTECGETETTPDILGFEAL
jgi:hypothetical protein